MRKGRQKIYVEDEDESSSYIIEEEEEIVHKQKTKRRTSKNSYNPEDDSASDDELSKYPNKKIKTSSHFSTLSYDNSTLGLKPNNANLPLYVGNMIKKYFETDPQKQKNSSFEYIVELFLETFNPTFKEGYEFVSLIAEPRSRQEFIQSFEINSASLFASVTLGFTAEDIIRRLEEFNKFDKIPSNIKKFIEETTSSFGKCRLVLKENNYFLESDHRYILEYYYNIKSLSDCWKGQIYKAEETSFSERETTINESTSRSVDKLLALNDNSHLIKCVEEIIRKEDTAEYEKKEVFRLMIKQDKIDKVRIEREGTTKYKYMLSQEYIFDRNEENELDINLKSNVRYFKKDQNVSRGCDKSCFY